MSLLTQYCENASRNLYSLWHFLSFTLYNSHITGLRLSCFFFIFITVNVIKHNFQLYVRYLSFLLFLRNFYLGLFSVYRIILLVFRPLKCKHCHMLLILLISLADTQSVMFSLNPYAVSNALCPSLWTSFSVWYHPSFLCEGRLLQPSFCELAVHVTHILIFCVFILFASSIF